MTRSRGRPPYADVLTPAEWRVVEAVRHGLSNRDIAARRKISADAVKYHVTNVCQKLGLPGRAALRQWDGVARQSVMSGKVKSMSNPLPLSTIGQISRSVSDIESARQWFADILGIKHLYSFGSMAFFDCDGVRLLLSQESGGQPNPSILYFRVDDIHATHKALGDKGVVFINAPHMIHRHDNGVEEWMAFFNDNEGRPLALLSQTQGD